MDEVRRIRNLWRIGVLGIFFLGLGMLEAKVSVRILYGGRWSVGSFGSGGDGAIDLYLSLWIFGIGGIGLLLFRQWGVFVIVFHAGQVLFSWMLMSMSMSAEPVSIFQLLYGLGMVALAVHAFGNREMLKPLFGDHGW